MQRASGRRGVQMAVMPPWFGPCQQLLFADRADFGGRASSLTVCEGQRQRAQRSFLGSAPVWDIMGHRDSPALTGLVCPTTVASLRVSRQVGVNGAPQGGFPHDWGRLFIGFIYRTDRNN